MGFFKQEPNPSPDTTLWAARAVYWAELSIIQAQYMVNAGTILNEYAEHKMSAEVAMHSLQEEYLVAGRKLIEYKNANSLPSIRPEQDT